MLHFWKTERNRRGFGRRKVGGNMRNCKKRIASILLCVFLLCTFAACDSEEKQGGETQKPHVPTVNAGNPILAGYHADPSAYKFGDTYYIYSTTDGYVIDGNAGWPMIWKSQDFLNWEAQPMELLWENGDRFQDAGNMFWAPSMLHWNDKYYLVFTQTNYYTMIAEGDTPEGPFTVLGNLFDTTEEMRKKDIYKTIDAQAFVDEDNRAYLIYLLRENQEEGDAVLYTAICELDPDNLTKVKHIEKIEELSHSYREGQELLKKDGKYYILYSEGSWLDASYHVRYAMSDNIYGPYTVKETILQSPPQDNQIIGTGHHSTLVDGDRYILVYHRQSIPFLGFGFRQVCADEIFFHADGTIQPVTASRTGVQIADPQKDAERPVRNIAVGATVTTEEPKEGTYRPAFMVDGENSSLWKSANRKGEKVLNIELDDIYDISRTEIYFEYGSKYYQYKLETSLDNETWELYADQTQEKVKGTPRKDAKEVTAKYIRLTLTGMESLSRNYGGKLESDPQRWKEPQRYGIFEFKVFGTEKK